MPPAADGVLLTERRELPVAAVNTHGECFGERSVDDVADARAPPYTTRDEADDVRDVDRRLFLDIIKESSSSGPIWTELLVGFSPLNPPRDDRLVAKCCSHCETGSASRSPGALANAICWPSAEALDRCEPDSTCPCSRLRVFSTGALADSSASDDGEKREELSCLLRRWCTCWLLLVPSRLPSVSASASCSSLNWAQ